MAANPKLGEAVAGGAIIPDAVDELAKAADAKTGRLPHELISATEGLTADQTSDVVDRFIEERIDVDEVEERFRQQMAARTVRGYRNRGLAGIAIEGPDPLIDAMWAHLGQAADARYQALGGRDTSLEDRETLEHRRFDAARVMLTGGDASESEPSIYTGGRPSVVIAVDGDQLFGTPDKPVVATQIGTGPIPTELLEQYMATAPISILLKGRDGAPLWLGRTRRNASDKQFLALAVRDRGCVLCRASINQCQAHHLMPWTAPGQGRTDVDQLALLCQRCHGDLHHRNHTLYRQRRPGGKPLWATRPATPNETPRAKPQRRQNE